jgi:hypothetical protein
VAAGPMHLDGALAAGPPLGCFSLAHRHRMVIQGA